MISERAMKIQLKMRNSHTTVIAVYAPTEVDEESESENFYEVLQDQIDKVNKKHFLIVLADFNARVAPNITDFMAPTTQVKKTKMEHVW